MILVDTSAWIEYDRATGSAVDQRLDALMRADAALAVTEPIVMEVVGGARSDARERDLRRLLARFTLLPFDTAVDFNAAVRIYRTCRRSGITPRGYVDCLIAAVAQRHRVPVLALDADFDRVAEVVGIDLATA